MKNHFTKLLSIVCLTIGSGSMANAIVNCHAAPGEKGAGVDALSFTLRQNPTTHQWTGSGADNYDSVTYTNCTWGAKLKCQGVWEFTHPSGSNADIVVWQIGDGAWNGHVIRSPGLGGNLIELTCEGIE